MSLNDQMAIKLTFSKTNMAKVAKELRKINNEYMDFMHTSGIALSQLAKTQKLKTASALINELSLDCGSQSTFKGMPQTRKFHFPVYSPESDLVVDEIYRGKGISQPRKSAFNKLTSKDKAFQMHVSHDAAFYVDVEKCTVVFHTGYNNHSADAIDLPYAQTILKFLTNRSWGRNEGGFSMYHSENNYIEYFDVDSPDDEYINSYYGSIGEKMKKDYGKHLRFKSRMYR